MAENFYEVVVKGDSSDIETINVTNQSKTISNVTNTYPIPTYTYWTYNPSIYLYQIFCPKPRCKTANWLQLDQIKPCKKCGSMLKAVSKKADYEIEVD